MQSQQFNSQNFVTPQQNTNTDNTLSQNNQIPQSQPSTSIQSSHPIVTTNINNKNEQHVDSKQSEAKSQCVKQQNMGIKQFKVYQQEHKIQQQQKISKNQQQTNIDIKKSQNKKTNIHKKQQLNDIQLQLLDMGFQKHLIQQALKLTQDKDKAIQYIITSIQNEQKIQAHKKKPKPKAEENIMKQQGNKLIYQNQDQEQYEDVQEQYKMVFLVRMDLKMGLGKIAAQVAHATLKAYKQMVQRANYNDLDFVALEEWKQMGQKKIVVKVNDENQMLATLKKATQLGFNNCYIRDAGLTQIASGSLTVGAIGPAPSSQIDKLTKCYKLL